MVLAALRQVVPPAGTSVNDGGGFPWGLIFLLALGVGGFILWRRRAGRVFGKRSAVALERLSQGVPAPPRGRYPRPGVKFGGSGDHLAEAQAALGLVHRWCIGCGKEFGISASGERVVIVCPACRGAIAALLGKSEDSPEVPL